MKFNKNYHFILKLKFSLQNLKLSKVLVPYVSGIKNLRNPQLNHFQLDHHSLRLYGPIVLGYTSAFSLNAPKHDILYKECNNLQLKGWCSI